MTTLAPYDFELAYADRSSISGAHGGGPRKQRDVGGSGAPNPANMSETAAVHVLASVTQKAKKLFVLMAQKQLDAVEEAGGLPRNDMQPFAIDMGCYSTLLVMSSSRRMIRPCDRYLESSETII